MIPMHVLTLIVTEPTQPSILVLTPDEESPEGISRVVPIWIGSTEAAQLSFALRHVRLPRPLTHDLFLDAITSLDASIDHVVITETKGATFFAELVLRQAGRLIPLDARPSDAIALALRQDAPFYIDEGVLERSSFPYIFKEKKDDEASLAEFKEFLETLSPEDFLKE